MPQWCPRSQKPVCSGWYYVWQGIESAPVGMRYFDDSNNSWWAPTKDGLVPNDSFAEFLYYPGISDRQGTYVAAPVKYPRRRRR